MRLDEFDYDLPEGLIALRPAPRRDDARMMVVDRAAGTIAHRTFREFPDLLAPGDVLVLNDTKVLPARLLGSRLTGGRVEFLLTEAVGEEGGRGVWRTMVRASKRLRVGEVVGIERGFDVRIVADEGEGFFLVELPPAAIAELDAHGHVPLPPYIAAHRPDDATDRERYQTVYAREPGSCAAPTAGLHFTPEVLAAVEARGVRVARLTLHVGPGTFLPVRVDDIEDHRMHEEAYSVPDATIAVAQAARTRGGRVVACGTTSARTLETWAATGEREGRSDLFIRPGYSFRVVDVLLTNFHLPKSTLLMLVAARAGMDLWRRAYEEAVRDRYRFYSYGDCMVIV
jgi:S-adenosylmethionine:tRNA ribosyltransferase-isomerase